jgi:hypothetical protein
MFFSLSPDYYSGIKFIKTQHKNLLIRNYKSGLAAAVDNSSKKELCCTAQCCGAALIRLTI